MFLYYVFIVWYVLINIHIYQLICKYENVWVFKFLIYLFLAALGLCFCTRASSSCSERGLLFIVVCRLLLAVASLVAEHGL